MRSSVKILRIDKVTHDVKRFTIEKPKGYEFTPGQATEVSISKDGFKDKKRPFTFTSLNENENLEFIIKAYPVSKYPNHTGVTEKIHTLKKGDELIIGEPWGTIEYKGPGVFIAGGAGITPFIAIFRELNKKNEMDKNKLLFSNKKKEDIILEDKLRLWFKPENLVLALTRDKNENYHSGRFDSRLLGNRITNFSQPFYVCGPKKMVSDLKGVLKEFGVKTDSIVFEK